MFNPDDDPLPEALRSRAFPLAQVHENPPELADAGLYIFVRVAPPHLTYLGRSRSLKNRVTAQRRIRQVFSHVLAFDFPGVPVSLATSRELERRALRSAWERWDWARWTNQTDLWVKFVDRCVWPGSPPMMNVVERALTGVEEFMAGQATFDPRRPTYLRMTHVLEGPCKDVHAFGTPTEAGFTVLAGSRLSLSFRSVNQLRSSRSQEAKQALQLWEQGILDHKSSTRTREEGLYFLHDQEFASPQAATTVLLGQRVETDQWREPTEEELLRFEVPRGAHRRWR